MTEIVTARFARQRAGAIRQGMRDYLKTLALIKEAWDQRDWEALGYGDWQSYVDGEFGAARLGLTPEHRRKAVEELRLGGMSQRAIASAVGVNRETVAKDLRDAQVAGFRPPDEITGADGKRYAATPPVVEAMRDSIERATEKAAEKAQIRGQYEQLREDLAAIPPETVDEILRTTQPTVDLRRITQACRDLVAALMDIDAESAADADCDPDELRVIDDAIALLTALHTTLGVPA